jgi:hypothetical protein
MNTTPPSGNTINTLGDHFGLIGVLLVVIFIASWFLSTLMYHRLGYSAIPLPQQSDLTPRDSLNS